MLIVINILILDMALNSTSSLFFSIPNFNLVKYGFIFDVENNSSSHVDNRKIYILVAGEGPSSELDDTVITVEAK